MSNRPHRLPIESIALDLWYTTWYHRADERSDYHRAKRRAWVHTLTDVGVAPPTARVVLDRLRDQLNRLERRGRASTLEQQAGWVGRQLGVRLETGLLVRRLDRALANARLHRTPGIRRFLEEVRSHGLPIGMVSNICDESPGGIRDRLRREGLLRFFDAIVLSSEFGRAKPDPAPFLACYRALGVLPSRTLFVGDLPVDHQGAARSHAQFILYLGVDRESPRSYRMKRLSEPPTTLRATSWAEIADHLFSRFASR